MENCEAQEKGDWHTALPSIKRNFFAAAMLILSILLYSNSYESKDMIKDLAKQPENGQAAAKAEVTVNKDNISYYDLKQTNERMSKELDEIRQQLAKISKENRELEEDNIALQNTLKMAASAGIKPQNYTRFNGINSRGGLQRGTYLGKFLGTAYTPSKEECGNDKGITNSGKPIIAGVTVAVDKKYWPFGTVFYIKGLGYAVAMDTGSAIKGRERFDFSVFDAKFAGELGSRYWDVYLVKLGKGYIEELNF